MATGNTKTSRTTSNKKNSAKVTKNSSKSTKTEVNSRVKASSKAKGKNNAEDIREPREKYELTEKEKNLRNEIFLIVSIAVTILLMLSNFGFLSPVGDYLRYFMFGLFGFLAYILPIVVFIGIGFYISNKNNRKCIIKLVSGGMLYVLLAALVQLVFMDYDSEISVFDYYGLCGKELSGGGFFGALIEKTLHSLMGTLGTYIVLFVLIIIAVVFLTEKSFIGGVKKSSNVVYETAKTETKRIKKTAHDYKAERAYQKKDKRMDNQVRGVAIQKIKGDTDEEDYDVHEINDDVMKNISSKDKEIYKGHIELDEINKEDDVHLSTLEDDEEERALQAHYDAMAQAELHVDEDGLFKPKERIEVSESAKNIMSRKAFSTGTVKTASDSKPPVSTTTSVNINTGSAYSANNTNNTNNANNTTNNNANNNVNNQVKKINKNYKLPSTNLLNKNTNTGNSGNSSNLKEMASKLSQILETFGVNAQVVDYSRGPSVTRYEIQPEIGTRLNKITSLADDIKLNLAVTDIRIEPIPGKTTIGIEVPNEKRESVLIRELIESKELMGNSSKIAFAAGKDIAGQVIVGDIAKMPHLLVAGTTGSGKSVFTNSIIMSILFRAKPSEVRLIIVDPKVVEFGVYNGIPHLLQPVVTDPKLASNTLKWAVNEMSERYKKFADFNVRDLKGYNEKVSTLGNEMGLEKMPQIVIVIDELADLMMVAAKEVEESICRLAQLARAAGIHLIIATQRPSVDVVTGLIKANIPSRCALMVSSGVDSRTVIDSNGAEKLLGNGDMLFYPSGYVKPVRLQGAFVSDEEVQRVVAYLKEQGADTNYESSLMNFEPSQSVGTGGQADGDGRDDYFFEAAKFVIEKEKASTSMLQRMFKIGFNRAARIMDQLYEAGVVGDEEGTKPRRVLMTLSELEQMMNNN